MAVVWLRILDEMNSTHINTTENSAQPGTDQRQSCLAWLRYGCLVVALLLPSASPSNCQSNFLFSSESESAYEDITECVSVVAAARQRKSRSGESVSRLGHLSSVSRTSVLQLRPVHCFDGHRIRNGMLAPMRC